MIRIHPQFGDTTFRVRPPTDNNDQLGRAMWALSKTGPFIGKRIPAGINAIDGLFYIHGEGDAQEQEIKTVFQQLNLRITALASSIREQISRRGVEEITEEIDDFYEAQVNLDREIGWVVIDDPDLPPALAKALADIVENNPEDKPDEPDNPQ